MQIHYYSEITAFKNLVTPFLLQYEAENNLILGLLERLEQNVYTFSETEKPVLIAIKRNNQLELVSIRTPPKHNQLLSYTENLETIKFLVDEMAKTTMDLPGVLGLNPIFLRQLCKELKSSSVLTIRSMSLVAGLRPSYISTAPPIA